MMGMGEMKRKDFVEAENGKIQKESIIEYIINKNGTDIREIIIKNSILVYREIIIKNSMLVYKEIIMPS